MTDERILKMLGDDLATGGHRLGEDVKGMSAQDLTSLANIVAHWNFQLQRELLRRASLPSDDR